MNFSLGLLTRIFTLVGLLAFPSLQWDWQFINSATLVVDNVVFVFQFIWTNPHLLPFLLPSSVFILSLISRRFAHPSSLITVLVFSGCLSLSPLFDSLFSFIWMNETSWVSNSLLLNKINRIHPPLFYLLFATLLLDCVAFRARVLKLTIVGMTWRVNVALAMLALGAWWAFQEGTWGGWWIWDASEILGWFLVLLFVTDVHYIFHCRSATPSEKIVLARLYDGLSLLISFLCLQFSWLLTSHTFGQRFAVFSTYDISLFILCLATVANWLWAARHSAFVVGGVWVENRGRNSRRKGFDTSLLRGYWWLILTPFGFWCDWWWNSTIVWFLMFGFVFVLLGSPLSKMGKLPTIALAPMVLAPWGVVLLLFAPPLLTLHGVLMLFIVWVENSTVSTLPLFYAPLNERKPSLAALWANGEVWIASLNLTSIQSLGSGALINFDVELPLLFLVTLILRFVFYFRA